MYLRYLQTPRLLISTIHVKLNMFEKAFHWGYTIQKEEMLMLRIKACMNIIFSLRYLCTFSYSKNNSKFTGSLLKIYVCDVNKTWLVNRRHVRFPDLCQNSHVHNYREQVILRYLKLYS
jgi:hypothetical protein